MSNVSVDQLAAEIAKFVKAYTDDVAAAIEQEVDRTADDILNEIKTNHPYRDRTGDYTRNFRKSKQDEPGRTRRIIWNKKHYRRVHLLEFGHAKRGGGRVPAYPHLRPAYDKHAPRLVDKIKQIIRNGG